MTALVQSRQVPLVTARSSNPLQRSTAGLNAGSAQHRRLAAELAKSAQPEVGLKFKETLGQARSGQLQQPCHRDCLEAALQGRLELASDQTFPSAGGSLPLPWLSSCTDQNACGRQTAAVLNLDQALESVSPTHNASLEVDNLFEQVARDSTWRLPPWSEGSSSHCRTATYHQDQLIFSVPPTGVPPWLQFVDVPCLYIAIRFVSPACKDPLLCTVCMQSLCVLSHLHATSVCSEHAKKLRSHAPQLVRPWERVCTGLVCHKLCVPPLATLSMIRRVGGSKPYAQALV